MRLILAACLALGAAPAVAQESCADHAKVKSLLASTYGETLQQIGLNNARNLVEVYASPETGTWTIIEVTPEGMACLMAAGEMWQAAIAGPMGEPL